MTSKPLKYTPAEFQEESPIRQGAFAAFSFVLKAAPLKLILREDEMTREKKSRGKALGMLLSLSLCLGPFGFPSVGSAQQNTTDEPAGNPPPGTWIIYEDGAGAVHVPPKGGRPKVYRPGEPLPDGVKDLDPGMFDVGPNGERVEWTRPPLGPSGMHRTQENEPDLHELIILNCAPAPSDEIGGRWHGTWSWWVGPVLGLGLSCTPVLPYAPAVFASLTAGLSTLAPEFATAVAGAFFLTPELAPPDRAEDDEPIRTRQLRSGFRVATSNHFVCAARNNVVVCRANE